MKCHGAAWKMPICCWLYHHRKGSQSQNSLSEDDATIFLGDIKSVDEIEGQEAEPPLDSQEAAEALFRRYHCRRSRSCRRLCLQLSLADDLAVVEQHRTIAHGNIDVAGGVT